MMDDICLLSFITGFFLGAVGWLLWFWNVNDLCKHVGSEKEDSRKNGIKGSRMLVLLGPIRLGLIGVGGFLAIEILKFSAGPLCLGIFLASVLGRIYIYMRLGRP